jgi:quercetin dioxygenase-like cupin family protein
MPPLTVNVQVVDAPGIPARGGDGEPRERATVGPGSGFDVLEQSMIELDPGATASRGAGDGEEVLFVHHGSGRLELAGEEHLLEPESGAYLAPGEEYRISNQGPEPLTLISVRIPDPDPVLDPDPEPDSDPRSPETPAIAATRRAVVRRLADQESEAATTDREFRIVADPGSGLRSATHFVGYIPTARAPEHFHTYNEVIYVLDGEGVLHAQGSDWPLHPGSCIQLPARVVHCLENTGGAVMRVAGVFRPAGSPAAAYYPDGTPAHAAAPPLSTQ